MRCIVQGRKGRGLFVETYSRFFRRVIYIAAYVIKTRTGLITDSQMRRSHGLALHKDAQSDLISLILIDGR